MKRFWIFFVYCKKDYYKILQKYDLLIKKIYVS